MIDLSPMFIALGILAVMLFIGFVIYCLVESSRDAAARKGHNPFDVNCKFHNFGTNEPISWSQHCPKCNPRRR